MYRKSTYNFTIESIGWTLPNYCAKTYLLFLFYILAGKKVHLIAKEGHDVVEFSIENGCVVLDCENSRVSGTYDASVRDAKRNMANKTAIILLIKHIKENKLW